jgi:hypothetical protein
VDGRAFIHAPGNDGELTISPFRFDGKALSLNFRTSTAGFIRVELQDFMGRPLKGYSLDESVELRGDELEGRACWKQGHDVSALAGQLIRMRIAMSCADLFSFKFTQGNRRSGHVHVTLPDATHGLHPAARDDIVS